MPPFAAAFLIPHFSGSPETVPFSSGWGSLKESVRNKLIMPDHESMERVTRVLDNSLQDDQSSSNLEMHHTHFILVDNGKEICGK